MAGYGLITNAKFYGVDDTGAPLSSGLLYTYEPGTTTAKTTYNAPAGSANANPVVLDSRGEADVWLNGDTKLLLKNAAGTTIWTVDNVPGIGNTYLDPITDYGTNLTDAVSAIGATETTLLIDCSVTVSQNTTVPSTIDLWFTRGGALSIDAGKTVTIAGQVTAGDWAVFDGNGSVSGIGAENDPVQAAWFGTTAARVNKAISAIGSTETSLLFDGSFTINADVTPASTTTTRYGRKASLAISNGFKFAPAGPIEFEACAIQNMIVEGLITTVNSPADMAGDVSAGVAYDSRGYKITVGTSQAIDFSTDRAAAATVPSAGNSRYITVIARIAKEWHGPITYDPVTGTNVQPTGGTQFVLEVVSGTAASSSPSRYIPKWYEVVLCDVLLTSSTTSVTWDMLDFTRAPFQSKHPITLPVQTVDAIASADLNQYGFYALTSYGGGSQPMVFFRDPATDDNWPVGPPLTASAAPASAVENGMMRFDPATQRMYVRQGGAWNVVRAPLRYEDLTSYYIACSAATNASFAAVALGAVLASDAVLVEVWHHSWNTVGNNCGIILATDDTNTDRTFFVSATDLRGMATLPIGSAGWNLYHKIQAGNHKNTVWVVGQWRN